MTENEDLTYFLMPHMALSTGSYRDLCFFLPHLQVLEVARQASIPEWAEHKISRWPVSIGGEFPSRIKASINAYKTFAQIHGGPGGILGFLNESLVEPVEPRIRIQEELRRGSHSEANPKKIFDPSSPSDRSGFLALDPAFYRAALFLEIARELDEGELELESGYDRLNAMEQEFLDILGIDDESESTETKLTPALVPDAMGLLYMLPKRIESWFRVFSLSPISRIAGMPVFVTCFREVVEEVIEMVRTGCKRSGKDFSVDAHPLISIPSFGEGQAQALVEEAPISGRLTACSRDLGELMRSASEGKKTAEFEARRCSLQGGFEKLRQEFQASEGHKTNLSLTVFKGVTLADLPDFSAAELAGEIRARPFVLLSVTEE